MKNTYTFKYSKVEVYQFNTFNYEELKAFCPEVKSGYGFMLIPSFKGWEQLNFKDYLVKWDEGIYSAYSREQFEKLFHSIKDPD